MHISNTLNSFLNDSQKLSHSIILLTDMNNIIFVSPLNMDYFDIFMNKPISGDLKKLFNRYNKKKNNESFYCRDSISVINLIYKDKIQYKSQIILPINDDPIDGLLIFFSTDRDYLPSNLRYAKTTKYFVEKLMKSS